MNPPYARELVAVVDQSAEALLQLSDEAASKRPAPGKWPPKEDWVKVQDYQSAPWEELVGLWHAYNLHLARVMRATPDDVRTRRHSRHNLHEIGWRTVSQNEPATLDFLMEDYVGHLKHHLAQIAMGDG